VYIINGAILCCGPNLINLYFGYFNAPGAPSDDKDKDMRTLLHVAAIRGHTTVLHHLLINEKGGLLEAPDRWGRTALFWAAKQSDVQSTRLLLSCGADPRPVLVELGKSSGQNMETNRSEETRELLQVGGIDSSG